MLGNVQEALSSFCEIYNGHDESSSIDGFYVEASRLSLLNKKSARKSFLPNTDKFYNSQYRLGGSPPSDLQNQLFKLQGYA
jgi:hypothetical protein